MSQTKFLYLSPDGVFYNSDYQHAQLSESQRQKLQQFTNQFPQPEFYPTYEQYEQALRQWAHKVRTELPEVILPQVIGWPSRLLKTNVGAPSSSGYAFPWLRNTIPPEPSPERYQSLAEYEHALVHWEALTWKFRSNAKKFTNILSLLREHQIIPVIHSQKNRTETVHHNPHSSE